METSANNDAEADIKVCLIQFSRFLYFRNTRPEVNILKFRRNIFVIRMIPIHPELFFGGKLDNFTATITIEKLDETLLTEQQRIWGK